MLLEMFSQIHLQVNDGENFGKNIEKPCISSSINVLPKIDMDITAQNKCQNNIATISRTTDLLNNKNLGKKKKTIVLN